MGRGFFLSMTTPSRPWGQRELASNFSLRGAASSSTTQ